MEIRKDLELVDVQYESNGQKAVLTFLDQERGQIRVVNFNRQRFDNGNYVEDEEKAAQVDKWCADYFETEYKKLPSCIGVKKDVYCYPKFNSLWEVDQVAKFTKDDAGIIIQTEVKSIEMDDIAIRIRYEWEGSTYESKMTFATYLDSMSKWFVDPQKKEKVLAKFEDKFGVSIDHKDELIGHTLMVEVKSAFGSNYYGDIKSFPKKK